MTVITWIIFVIVILEESVHTLNLSSIIRKILNIVKCYFFIFKHISRTLCICLCVFNFRDKPLLLRQLFVKFCSSQN
jgi:hypothetical protein